MLTEGPLYLPSKYLSWQTAITHFPIWFFCWTTQKRMFFSRSRIFQKVTAWASGPSKRGQDSRGALPLTNCITLGRLHVLSIKLFDWHLQNLENKYLHLEKLVKMKSAQHEKTQNVRDFNFPFLKIGEWLLYNVVLVSSVQRESAVSIHISPPSRALSHHSRLSLSSQLSFLCYIAASHYLFYTWLCIYVSGTFSVHLLHLPFSCGTMSSFPA